KRGGHDQDKVYAAYKAAVECKDRPTVILAATIKGYGLGEAGEGMNTTHQAKKLKEKTLYEVRNRFALPLSDEAVAKAVFYKPADDSPEMKYLKERRQALGGSVPERRTKCPPLSAPPAAFVATYAKGSGDKTPSTTMVLVDMMARLMKDAELGKWVVPIIPDE